MAPKRPRGDSAAKISRQKEASKKWSGSASAEERGDDACPAPTPTATWTEADPGGVGDHVVAELEAAILALLRSRKPGSNCCPSEVPRRMMMLPGGAEKGGGGGGGGGGGDWRGRMPAVREAAARLVERGQLEITQGGVAVRDPRSFRGPIRLRLVTS